AAVERVGHDAAQHREDDDRDDLDGAYEPERDRFAPGRGKERHVPEDGGGLHPRAREGEELADPEEREVAMPQGGEGDGDAARERQSHGRQATSLTPSPPLSIVPPRSGRMRVRAKD